MRWAFNDTVPSSVHEKEPDFALPRQADYMRISDLSGVYASFDQSWGSVIDFSSIWPQLLTLVIEHKNQTLLPEPFIPSS